MPTIAVAAITSGLSVPFENARAAYYADRTYPTDLRKGYKSIFDALRRIPSEEGANYLIKGAPLIMARNYCMFSVSVYLYDFQRDFFYLMREDAHGGDMSRFFRIATPIVLATAFGCIFACPWDNAARYMVEFQPKINGECVYNGNYRKALIDVWYWHNKGNYWAGLSGFYLKHAPTMGFALYFAENLGLFQRWKHNSMLMAANNDTDNNYQ